MKVDPVITDKNEPVPSKSSPKELEDIRIQAENDPAAIGAYAQMLRQQSSAMYLHGISKDSPLAAMPLKSLQQYVEDYVLDQVGDDCSHDPVLKTLIEQLLLANQMASRLYCDAVNTQDMELKRISIQLATSLTGEIRRLSKEIREQAERHSRRLSIARTDERSENGRGAKNKKGSKQNVA